MGLRNAVRRNPKPQKASEGKGSGGNTLEGGQEEGSISFLASDVEVDGDVTSRGSVRIDGRVNGGVRAGGTVLVGTDGVVRGDLSAANAVVAGRVEGCVVVENRTELQGTARIDGEMRTAVLRLDDGAILNGTVSMESDGEAGDRGEASAGSRGASGESSDREEREGASAPSKGEAETSTAAG